MYMRKTWFISLLALPVTTPVFTASFTCQGHEQPSQQGNNQCSQRGGTSRPLAERNSNTSVTDSVIPSNSDGCPGPSNDNSSDWHILFSIPELRIQLHGKIKLLITFRSSSSIFLKVTCLLSPAPILSNRSLRGQETKHL